MTVTIHVDRNRQCTTITVVWGSNTDYILLAAPGQKAVDLIEIILPGVGGLHEMTFVEMLSVVNA